MQLPSSVRPCSPLHLAVPNVSTFTGVFLKPANGQVRNPSVDCQRCTKTLGHLTGRGKQPGTLKPSCQTEPTTLSRTVVLAKVASSLLVESRARPQNRSMAVSTVEENPSKSTSLLKAPCKSFYLHLTLRSVIAVLLQFYCSFVTVLLQFSNWYSR
jgi:hypothetical protein